MSGEKKVVKVTDTENVLDSESEEVYEISESEDEDQEVVYADGDPAYDENIELEDVPDDEPLWQGGPKAEQVKAWKSEFGEIFVTSISYDKHVIWRPLNRLEYKQIVKKMEQMVQDGEMTSAEANMWNEEVIAATCMLYPDAGVNEVGNMMAGLASLISQEVLEASGFVALEVRQL